MAATVVDLPLVLPFNHKAASATVAADGHDARQARRLHAGNAFDALDYLPVKQAALRFCITQQVDPERYGKNFIGVESGMRELNLAQASQKQSRSDQQHQR